ncbi:MAG: TonB-dependent receptor [Pseudomonadota bacterium]
MARFRARSAVRPSPRFLHPHPLALAASTALVGSLWALPCAAQSQPTARGAASPEAASEGRAAQDNVLTDVVVTSQKRSEKIQDVPVPIQAISGDKVQAANLRLSTDVERLAPSLSGQGGGRTAKPRWFLRGIGTNDPNATIEAPIAVYTDEVVIGLTRLQSFPLFDLERVEVLSGPQGTLWGKNNTGGALHFVSKRPTFEPEGHARVTFGNHNNRIVEAAVSDAIQAETLAARVSLYNESYDGWARNILNGQDGPQLKDANARIQFLAYPNADLEAHLILNLRQVDTRNTPSYAVGGRNAPGSAVTQPNPGGRITQGQTAGQLAAGGGYLPPYGADPNAYSPFFDGGADGRQERDGATFKLNYKWGANTLTSITGWSGGTGDSLASVSVPLNTTLARQSTQTEDSFRQFTQELRLASPGDRPVSWILGAYHYELDADATTRIARFANGGSPTIVTNRDNYNQAFWDQSARSDAVFGNLKFKLTPQAAIGLGLRVTREEKTITESNLNVGDTATNSGIVNYASENGWFLPGAIGGSGNRTPLTLSASDAWTNTTFDVTPEYRFSPTQLGYLRIATGFRSGGFNQTITQPSGGAPFINVLKPETLTNIEVGYKSTLADGKVRFNAAAFHYDLKNTQLNIQQAVTDASGNVVTSASGQADGTVDGLELDLDARVQRAWRVGGQLGLLRAKYKNFDYQVGSVALNASGNAFYRTPRVQLRLDTDYTVNLSRSASRWVFGTDWSYRSRIFHNATVQNDPLQETPAHWTGNVRASYHAPRDKWEVVFFVNNVTDKNKPFLRQIVNTTNGTYPVSVGAPRTLGVQLAYRL